MSVRSFRAAALAAVATAAITASPAFAQEAAAPTAPAAVADTAAIPDIVVTAERRSQNLQKVPVSVGVLNGNALRDIQAGGDDTLLSLSGRVPSLYVESTTGRIFPRFYIRGLGNIDFYLGASQPVSIIHDEVVLEHVILKSNPAFDIGQVEVLRGPQGSLFGRNTTAGIIKFDTLKPTQSFQGRGQASYGSFGSINADAGFGGPIVTDKLAFRVSGLYQHRDNWIDNSYTGTTVDGTQVNKRHALGGFTERDLRLQLLLTPSDRLSFLASGHVRNYRGTSTIFYRQSLARGSNGLRPGFNLGQAALDEGNGNPQHYHSNGVSLNIGYDFGGVKLTSITAYETAHGFSRGDTDGGAAANFPVNGAPNGFGQSQGRLRDLDQVTQEVRLASTGTGPFKWQVGGIAFDARDHTEFDQRGFFIVNSPAYNPNNWVLLHNVNTSWGLFGQASYTVGKLTLTAGVRETKDTKTTQLVRANANAAGVSTYAGRRFVRLSDKKPSWDASALYAISPEVSLYARAARGFRGPTIQGRSAVFNADFTTANSETNTSFEAGVKTSLLDNRLRFNATAFTYTVKNIQLNGNDSNGNGVLFNADKAKAYGLEADAELRPVTGLTLHAGVSLLHSAIHDKRVYAQVCALNGVVVCTVLNPTVRIGTNTFAQIDGNPLPNAPKVNFDFSARYEAPVGPGRAFIATDWNIQGYTSLVPYKTVEFTSKGNYEGGLKLGYTWDGYEVAAFARNITNRKNLKGVIENYMAGVYNDPRVLGVSLGAKFK